MKTKKSYWPVYVAFALAAIEACSPAVKQAVAKDSYEADQNRCVEQYDTKDEIDACRQYERARWGKGQVVWPQADAGAAEGGAK